MRLTKQTSYAIRILTHCAGCDSARSSEIARTYGITEYNIGKIIPMLVRAGFLKTTRGRLGGVKLARPASEIVIGDVLRVTEQTYVEAECVGGPTLPCAIRRTAPINRLLNQASEAFISVLDKHTLADLVGQRPAPALEGLVPKQQPHRREEPALSRR